MYPYMNEDVAWRQLQDRQREMENSRRLASGYWLVPILGVGLRAAAAVSRLASALKAAARTAQPGPELDSEETDASSEVA